jgi:hypothetical protein
MPQKTKASAKAKATAKKVIKGLPAKNTGKLKAVKPEAKPAPVMAKGAKSAAPKAAKAPAVEIQKAKDALKVTKATPEPAAKPEKMSKRKLSIVASANEAASALAQKWSTLFKKSEQIEAKPYNMKAVFEEKTAIVHKVLGWGYILANRNDRLEVLFKDGIKYLISNYKP